MNIGFRFKWIRLTNFTVEDKGHKVFGYDISNK